ncbi:MAG: hypothetical protein NVSMB64_00880 [Candidatus Velthaea sp.]
MSELVAISRYWTPYHIDVTHLPVRYAPPKAPWIDKLAEHQRLSAIDFSDRLARRRANTNAVVEPQEIPVLPAIQPAPTVPSRAHTFVVGVRTAIARRLARTSSDHIDVQAHPA